MTAAHTPHHRAPWPPPAVPVAAVPAGWYADPHRRADLRWWDGSSWTEHDHGPAPVAFRAAAFACAALVALRVLSEVALAPVRDVRPLWLLAALFYVVLYGAMAVVALRARRAGRPEAPPLRREVAASDLWRGPLVWATTLAAGVIAAVVIRAVDLPMRANGDLVDTYRKRDLAVFAVTAVAAVVLAPLVEELFFRGVLLRGFAARWGSVPAVVLQGLIFGVYHVIPRFGTGNLGLVLVLTCYGLVFGAWAQHTGRLGPTIVGHVLVNAVAITVAFVR